MEELSLATVKADPTEKESASRKNARGDSFVIPIRGFAALSQHRQFAMRRMIRPHP